MVPTDDKSFFKTLTQDQIDALQELGNIGSGHSATALSDLLNRKIDMSLPRFSILSLDELSHVQWQDQEKGTPYGMIITETTGDLELYILVIFNSETTQDLLRIISESNEEVNFNQLSSLDRSIIKECGSILSLHYLTALNEFLGTKSFPSSPIFVFETSETILSNIAVQIEPDFTHLVLIECDVFTTDLKLKPIVILIPKRSSLEKSIKLMFGEG